jgi:hypothetical protein
MGAAACRAGTRTPTPATANNNSSSTRFVPTADSVAFGREIRLSVVLFGGAMMRCESGGAAAPPPFRFLSVQNSLDVACILWAYQQTFVGGDGDASRSSCGCCHVCSFDSTRRQQSFSPSHEHFRPQPPCATRVDRNFVQTALHSGTLPTIAPSRSKLQQRLLKRCMDVLFRRTTVQFFAAGPYRYKSTFRPGSGALPSRSTMPRVVDGKGILPSRHSPPFCGCSTSTGPRLRSWWSVPLCGRLRRRNRPRQIAVAPIALVVAVHPPHPSRTAPPPPCCNSTLLLFLLAPHSRDSPCRGMYYFCSRATQ